MRGTLARPLAITAVLLLYLAAGSLSLGLVAQPENIAYFWPAAGIAAGALLVCPSRMRAPFASAIAAAVIIANISAGRSIAATAIFTVGNLLEALLFAALAARMTRRRMRLSSIREVNILIVAAAAAALLSSLLITALLRLTAESAAGPMDLGLTWAIADFVGIVTVAPMLIAFANDGFPRFDGRLREGTVALGLLGLVAFYGYHQDPAAPSWVDMTAFSATLPFLIWIAARAPRQISAVAPALVAIIAVAQTAKGFGPYAHDQYSPDERVTAAQFELVIFAVMALYLAALFEGYRRALKEVSERRTELESRFSELEALYAEAPLGLGMLDADLRFVRINAALAEMNGFPAEAHIGQSVWDLVPALREEAEPPLRQVLETGEPCRDIEIHGSTPANPGQIREWFEQFYPVKLGNKVIGVGIVCEDVTERRRAQNRERLLSREVDHRAKNLLAVVNSIVQLSHAESVPAYRDAVSNRIYSLARTHSLLAGSRWEGAELRQIVTDELSPFLRSGRIVIDGPVAHLGASATQDIALVLHELATNAAKYGALSQDTGRLAVTWTIADDGEEPVLHLSWHEEGGPPVSPPQREGFGSALVEATLSGQLKGRADFDWRPEGLHLELAFPIGASVLRVQPGGDLPATRQEENQPSKPLAGLRILLLEDEPLIGLHAQNCLESAGCEVVGPIARIEPAMVAARESEFDFAVLDINLAGQMTFRVADNLIARGKPFAFCSGYVALGDIPERFAGIDVLRKPLSESTLVAAVARLGTRSFCPEDRPDCDTDLIGR